MGAFGIFLKQLRELRGMSQRELAKAAGVSESSVKHFEYSDLLPKRSTVGALLLALEKHKDQQLSSEERTKFLQLGGFQIFHDAFQAARAASRPPTEPPVAHLDDEAAAADDLLRVTKQHGARRIMRLVNAALALAIHSNIEPTPAATAADDEVDVISPPVQREGYVEQVITTYSTGKSAKPATRKVRKRGSA